MGVICFISVLYLSFLEKLLMLGHTNILLAQSVSIRQSVVSLVSHDKATKLILLKFTRIEYNTPCDAANIEPDSVS